MTRFDPNPRDVALEILRKIQDQDTQLSGRTPSEWGHEDPRISAAEDDRDFPDPARNRYHEGP